MMKNWRNKLISLLLTLVMVVGMIPLTVIPTVAATTVDVGGGTYRALMDAADSANASTTLRLTKDISITTNNSVWLGGKSFTLDLYGHSITSTQREALYIYNGSNVKIINSNPTTRATITGVGNGGMDIRNNSTVRIEGAITVNSVYVNNDGSTIYADDPQVKIDAYNYSCGSRVKWYQYSVSSWAELKHYAALAPNNGTAATITLTADIPAANEFLGIVKGQNITLDMNGHNITSTQGNSAIYSQVDCTMTIKNSSTTRSTIKGTVNTSSNSGMGAIWSVYGGKYYIQGNVTLNGVYGSTFYIDGPNVIIDNFFGSSQSYTYYKVSYNANGGANLPAANYKQHAKNLTLSSTAPTRTGYTLKGWNAAANGKGTNYGFTYTTNAATTLYAQWSQNQNLTYNANGHNVTAPAPVTMTYTVATNTAYGLSDLYSGYDFDSWNTKADGTGAKYAANAQFKAANTDPTATTLYAIWKPQVFDVKLNKNGGTGGADSVTATYDADMPTIEVPTKVGYTFAGYSKGTGQYYMLVYDANGNSAAKWNGPKGSLAGYELDAQWTVNKYNVTLNNVEEADRTKLTSYTYGSGATLPDPTRSKYHFLGWFDNGGFTGNAVTAITTTEYGDKEFFAKWAEIEEKATLEAEPTATAPVKYYESYYTDENGKKVGIGELKEVTITDWHLTHQKDGSKGSYCDVGGLMGHQVKSGESGVGRTIIGLTEDMLGKITSGGKNLVIVGGDSGKQTTLSIDCAYTYFYNGDQKIEAGKGGLENIAAFVIIENDGDPNNTISGYGYYRLYSDIVDDANHFLFDVMFKKPSPSQN